MNEIKWRRAKAGTNFGKDTVVVYDGDPDARLVRCAVHDCFYIHVEDLMELPTETKNDNDYDEGTICKETSPTASLSANFSGRGGYDLQGRYVYPQRDE